MQLDSRERLYKLLGYINILEKAPPNGAVNHELRSLVTILRLKIYLNEDIDINTEVRIKTLIRRIY